MGRWIKVRHLGIGFKVFLIPRKFVPLASNEPGSVFPPKVEEVPKANIGKPSALTNIIMDLPLQI